MYSKRRQQQSNEHEILIHCPLYRAQQTTGTARSSEQRPASRGLLRVPPHTIMSLVQPRHRRGLKTQRCTHLSLGHGNRGRGTPTNQLQTPLGAVITAFTSPPRHGLKKKNTHTGCITDFTVILPRNRGNLVVILLRNRGELAAFPTLSVCAWLTPRRRAFPNPSKKAQEIKASQLVATLHINTHISPNEAALSFLSFQSVCHAPCCTCMMMHLLSC